MDKKKPANPTNIWKKKNTKAIFFLVNSIDDNISDSIRKRSTAKLRTRNIFRKLDNIYQK